MVWWAVPQPVAKIRKNMQAESRRPEGLGNPASPAFQAEERGALLLFAAYDHKGRLAQYSRAATRALTGMVSTHAHSRLMVTPQRTALSRLVAPTPMMEPVMVWVVLTGMPRASVMNRVMAPAVSALTPSKAVTLVIRLPMVLTMRQPPSMVPKLMLK